MADNVNITAGAGVVIATDQVGTDHYQRIKLTDGTADSSAVVAVDIGVKANALRVAPANNITDGTYIGDIKFAEGLAAGTNNIGDVDILTIAAGDNNIGNVDIVTMPADTFAADAQVYGKGVLCQGDDGTDRRAILVGTDGHVQVDVLSGGGGTEYTEDVATPATIVGLATMMERDDALAGLTPVEGDWASLRCDANGALWTHDNVVNTLLTTIDSDTNNIKTAVELLDNAVDGNYLNVNLNAAGTDLSMNSGVLTAQTLRVTIATDDECNNFLGTIDADTSNMVTALQIIDDWDDSDKCKVIIQTGANAIGKLAANTGVDIGDVDVTSIIPLTGATNLGKARDVACGANDVGVMALAVRDDTLTTLTPVDGDYVPLRVGSTGALHTTVSNITACNTGAVVISSGTVTTVSTVTNLAQMGGVAIALNEGVLGTGVQRVTLATNDDAVAHLATIAGDTTNIETAIQIIDDWDATHASAAPADGAQVMGAGYSAGLPTDVGADGDAARICTDRHGRILSGVMPQNFQATFTSADAQAATPVKVKTADRKMYILSLVVSVDTAMNVQFQDDTGPTILIEGMYFAANGGAHLTWPAEAPLVVNTNEDFDVITSAAGNISVTITGYLAV